MSDTEDTDDPPRPNGKRRPTDRDKALVESLPVDEELFSWLEALFYGDPEPAHFPEKIDLHVMEGKSKRSFGQCLKIFPFAPKKAPSKKAQEEAGVQYMGENKPNKEKLVALCNQIVGIMKRDADSSGHSQTYGICAWHGSLSDEPYDRTTRNYKPRGLYKSENGVEEDEVSDERRYFLKMQEEQREMVTLVGSIWEGSTDRDHRTIEAQRVRIAYLERRVEELTERLERALSLELEREERRQSLALKNRVADRSFTLVENYAPLLLPKLLGMPPQATQMSELMVLKKFFLGADEGGQLTNEQILATFGWDHKTEKFVCPGILTEEQAQILFRVANELDPVADLDKLNPGMPAGITTDQIARLQQVFKVEQLLPLFEVFQRRQQAAHTASAPKES